MNEKDKLNNELTKKLYEFTKLEEMAYKIGTTNDSYIIYVNSNDGGNIPHFHYVDVNSLGSNKKGFHSCIRIDKAEYFNHEGKEDKLNSKQKKELQKFLQQPFRDKRVKMTNYEFIVMTWNDNNSSVILDENIKMPNYLNLK